MSFPHIVMALVISAIWGFSFVASKAGLDHFPPLFFTALRFLLVAILLSPFLKIVKGRMKAIFWIAITVGVFHFTFLYLGIFAAGGITAVAITSQLIAPFSVIMAVVILKESIGWRRILGIVMAFGGVMVLGFDPVIFDQLEGVALVAVAGLFMALGLILMRQIQNVRTMSMQAWIGAISALPLLLLSFALESGQVASVVTMGWEAFGALAFVVIVTTIIAHGGWYYLIQRYPIAALTPFGLLAPIFGVAFGVILFSEPITLRFLLGGAITLVGVAIINLRTAKKAPNLVNEPEV
ncbi:DMT family transporter [Sneathiella litorea]|uniref:EamA family transporter n=1 Tax=Sneathiella litorea TaxID=2606216 RepID=A0A6L8W2J7_9PROT|nr:DMT family transporter [Sneathiella litorea]MZR29148.1 EamA family transporter [Sneathiella litorea]